MRAKLKHKMDQQHRMDSVFIKKYDEFVRDLLGACPELTSEINVAAALSPEQRRDGFREQVLPFCSPTRHSDIVPTFVLPGVKVSQDIWDTLSRKSKLAIQEYLTMLSFTYLMEAGEKADLSGNGWNAEWAEKMADDMKSKMEGMDFAGISEKIAGLFGAAGAAGLGGAAGAAGAAFGGFGGIPQIPEKFMKGQIAKLAEEIVKEIKIEDFGLSPAELESAGNDPNKALQMILDVLRRNPMYFQNTVKSVGKKLQKKIQSGAIRPKELVAEAEELMKTFSDNPQFVSLMESFRKTFGFADNPEAARAAGNDPNPRLDLVRERLRKKLEKKNGGKNH